MTSLNTRLNTLTPQIPHTTLVIVNDTYYSMVNFLTFKVRNNLNVTVLAELSAVLYSTSGTDCNKAAGTYLSQIYQFQPLNMTVTKLNLSQGVYTGCGTNPVVSPTMDFTVGNKTQVSVTYNFNSPRVLPPVGPSAIAGPLKCALMPFYGLERPFSTMELTPVLCIPPSRKMKTSIAKRDNHARTASATFRSALLGITVLLVGSSLLAGVAKGSTFNNVQIFVNTSSQLQYSYSFSAYNLTGSLLGTYQGSFPAAAFELPSGDYLFTVSATYQNYGPCYVCAYSSSGAPVAKGGTSSYPAIYYQPRSEYGYKVVHVDSSQSLNIDTKNVTQFPTTDVTVKVSYVNGTAAAGASVSASIVGQWYYWWGQDSKIMMGAQTGKDGVARLVLPVAPAVVTAWNWVPINLPASQTTVVSNVGGENINVTVYWQPSYVGLSASALLIPPANSANLTLHYQQPSYWVQPMGAQFAPVPYGAGGATIANQPTGVPSQVIQTTTAQNGQSQYYLPSQIPPLRADTTPTQSAGAQGATGSALTTTATVGAAGLFAAVVIVALVFTRKQSPPKTTA